MGRKSKQEDIVRDVRKYIHSALENPDDDIPINIKAIAAALAVSRTSIYKNKDLIAEINQAARQQKQASSNISPQSRRIREQQAIIERQEKQIKALLARLCLVEANAQRFDIDPNALYASTPKPDRSVSHAGRSTQPRVFNSAAF